MNRRMLIAGSLRTLRRYKLRTFFMSLGIVIGVAVLVIMRSVGSGAQQQMLDRFEKVFSGASIFVVNTRGKLTMEDIDAIRAELPQIVDWSARQVDGLHEARYADRHHSVMIYGESERAEITWNRGVSAGEYFTKEDVSSAARVALLGHKTATALFGDEDPIGKRIQLANAPFRIKGVLEEAGVGPHGNDRDDAVHVPITTVLRRILNINTIDNAKLMISSMDEVEGTAEAITAILRERHAIAPGEPEDFRIFTPVQVQGMIKEANRVMTIYLPAASAIALLVAAIVIANLMLIGVRERIAEIGLRKALGATNRQISGQFLLESLAVTVLSGLVGAALGAGLLFGYGQAGHQKIAIAPDGIVLGLIAALVVGALAGFLPARRAALAEPVDALR